MTINRNNFEAYLLDYLEGNLNPLLTADLMAFLAENPEYEKFIPDFEIQPLIAHSGEYSNKQFLKKDFPDFPQINQENFDEFCIAYCEGLLGEKDSMRLKEYIAQHSEKQKDLELFIKLRLQPDLSIGYHDKAGLKKPAGRSFKLRYLYYGLSMAASIALILLLLINRKSGNFRETVTADGMTRNHPVNIPAEEPQIQVATDNTLPAESFVPAQQNITRAEKINHPAKEPVEISVESLYPPRQNIQLSALEPIGPELPVNHLRREIKLPGKSKVPVLQEPAQKISKAEWIDSESLLGHLISKVDLWKTAETAIDGFNYLTEARISIAKTTDEKGNTSGLVLSTESYSIETK